VDSVNELVLGLMVDLARGISAASAAYHSAQVPEITMGTQLSGATLGVVGHGAIGSKLAVLGAQLGMNVLVHDPRVDDVPGPARAVDLPRLLAAADFVVCLVVATERTENLFDAKAFAQMKRGAFFINASRGNLVDEQALHAALSANALAGAAMDVGRAADQMPSMALAKLPNVIATPHIGGLTRQAVAHQALETVAQVRCLLAGEVPRGAVNADRASRL
jgi:D-3-phosphoglycerate dehydrogenase